MTDGGMRDRIIATRAAVRQQAARRVRDWVFGSEMIFPGDPRRNVVMDHTVVGDFQVLRFGPDDGQPVTIGRFSGLTHSAIVLPGGLHRTNWVNSVHVHLEDGKWVFPEGALHDNGPVVIGNDVLITFDVLIMSGVTIGDGAIIAPRSVVTRDVEPYSIVGGNPARHLKFRFDEDTIAALLRIRWWDWPDEKVAEHRWEIDSDDVQGFIERHDPARREA
jgi:acetyltransferase-like isoleucine patch superfamily enzyme